MIDKRLAEYFKRNAEANERIRKLLHEAEDYDYTRLKDEPGSRWEKKLIDLIPRYEMEAAINKWKPIDKNLTGDKKIIAAAKKGDKSAAVYIWTTKVRDVAAQNFWKFLGPNPIIRKRRIDNGEFYDYASLAWGVMTFGNKDLLGDAGLIERFNLKKYDHGTVWKQFRNMFRLLLQNATTAYNNEAKLGGISGLKGSIARGTLGKDEGITHQSYDAVFDDVEAAGGKNNVWRSNEMDAIVDRESRNDEEREFLIYWEDFSKDEDMTLGESPTAAEVFAAVVGESDATVSDLADRWGVKPATINSKMEQAIGIMNDYGISNDDLKNGIELIGNAKLAKYLDRKAGEYESKRRSTKEKPAARTDSSNEDKKKSYGQSYYQRMKAEGRIPQKKRN